MSSKSHIVTLDDLNNDNNSNYEGTATNFRDNNNEAATTARAIASPQTSGGYFDYCKPIGQGHSAPPKTIPLCVVPGLVRSDACRATLSRIHDEFGPIIRRRGYRIASISELCCCGDGLDDHRAANNGGRRRRRNRMGNNVLGYNQTTTVRSRGQTKPTLHSIHLRLRRAQNHHQMFPWEDVAGTMAHELAHCVHQNHSKAFYQLMEEILEEHAVLQAQKLSSSSSSVSRTTNNQDSARATAVSSLSNERGHRLGGGTGGGTGTSRLLGEYATTNGRFQLGGQKQGGQTCFRELAAKAAESRQKQMQQLRRIIERSKEPCVIEIFDDEETEKDENAEQEQCAPKDDDEITVVETIAPNRKRRTRKPHGNRNNHITSNTSKPTKRRAVPQKQEAASNDDVIDLTAIVVDGQIIASNTSTSWSCGICTYKNISSSTLCEMCHGRR